MATIVDFFRSSQESLGDSRISAVPLGQKIRISEESSRFSNDDGIETKVMEFCEDIPFRMVEESEHCDESLFSQNISPDRIYSVNELIDKTDPLFSVFPKVNPSNYSNLRTNVQFRRITEQRCITLKFDNLSTLVPPIEPLLMSIFLFDTEINEKISQTWTFYLCPHEKYPLIAPVPVITSFSYDESKTSSIFLVATIERLLLKDGAVLINEYYKQPMSHKYEDSLTIVNSCGSRKLFTVFGYSKIALEDVTGATNSLIFQDFIPTSTVCDTYLFQNLIESESIDKSSITIPFSVSFKLIKDQMGEKMASFNIFNNEPSLIKKNTLILQLKKSIFRFPPSRRGRNLFAKIEIIDNDIPLPVFPNQKREYLTRCQYHVANPEFSEDIILDLPQNISSNSEVRVSFFHAVVKSGIKEINDDCGIANLCLFENGVFIENGIHKVLIQHNAQFKSILEENHIQIHTHLFSSVFTTSKTVYSITKGQFDKLVLISLQEIQPHFYIIMDCLFTLIRKGEKAAFKWLLKILKLFPRERASPDSYYLCYYSQFLSLRYQEDNEFAIQYLKLWNGKLEKSIKSKGSLFYCSWFLFEILEKSFLLSSQKEAVINDIIVLYRRLTNILPLFAQTSSAIGLELNRQMANFLSDMMDQIPYDTWLSMFERHMKMIQPSMSSYCTELFNEFTIAFFTPSNILYCISHLPIYETEQNLFVLYILPVLSSALSNFSQIEPFCRHILYTLCHYSYDDQSIVITGIQQLLQYIGKQCMQFPSLPVKEHIFMFTLCCLIGYRSGTPVLNEYLASLIKCILNQQVSPKGSLLRRQTTIEPNRNMPAVRQTTRERRRSFSFAYDESKTISQLSFCYQILGLKWLLEEPSVYSLNSIIIPLFQIPKSTMIQEIFLQQSKKLILSFPRIIFEDSRSNIKHLIRQLIADSSGYAIEVLRIVFQSEKSIHNIPVVFNSCLSRALFKEKIWKAHLRNYTDCDFYDLMEKLHLLDNQIESSDPVFRILYKFKQYMLLNSSPDVSIELLLAYSSELENNEQYEYTAIVFISITALIAQCMHLRDLLPGVFSVSPLSLFSFLPKEIFPQNMNSIPNIRGIANSKYFNLHGFLYFLKKSLDSCIKWKLNMLGIQLCSVVNSILYKLLLWDELKQFSIAHSVFIHQASQKPLLNPSLNQFFLVRTIDMSYIYHYPSGIQFHDLFQKICKQNPSLTVFPHSHHEMASAKEVVILPLEMKCATMKETAFSLCDNSSLSVKQEVIITVNSSVPFTVPLLAFSNDCYSVSPISETDFVNRRISNFCKSIEYQLQESDTQIVTTLSDLNDFISADPIYLSSFSSPECKGSVTGLKNSINNLRENLSRITVPKKVIRRVRELSDQLLHQV